MASIDDLTSVVDDLVILSFIIQLSVNQLSDVQKEKIVSNLYEVLTSLEGGSEHIG